jgi:hypothetical protein
MPGFFMPKIYQDQIKTPNQTQYKAHTQTPTKNHTQIITKQLNTTS